jgi:hypothetical protein
VVADLIAAADKAGVPVVTGATTLPGSTVVTAGESMPDPAQVFGGGPLAGAPSPAAAEASPTAPAAPTDTSTASNAAPPAPATATAGAPAAAPAPANGAVALDKTGLPWDERIHSGSRAQNKDGTWRLRKGVAEMTVKAVERELREGMANAQPASAAAPAAPPAPPAPEAPPAPAAAPAAPPAPAASGAPLDFPGIVTRVVKLQGEGKLTQTDLTAHAAAIGLAAFADLARHPELFQSFVDRLPA